MAHANVVSLARVLLNWFKATVYLSWTLNQSAAHSGGESVAGNGRLPFDAGISVFFA